MSKIFRTPLRYKRPPVRVDTPRGDRKPAIYFSQASLVDVGVNVWLTVDNTVTETQPVKWELVKTMYQGGAENIITDAEAAFLIAANPEYAGCMFDIGSPPPTGGGGTGGSGSGFGVGGFGTQGFGT